VKVTENCPYCSQDWTYCSCSVLGSRRGLCNQVCSLQGVIDIVAASIAGSLWYSNSSHTVQTCAWQNPLHTQYHWLHKLKDIC